MKLINEIINCLWSQIYKGLNFFLKCNISQIKNIMTNHRNQIPFKILVGKFENLSWAYQNPINMGKSQKILSVQSQQKIWSKRVYIKVYVASLLSFLI